MSNTQQVPHATESRSQGQPTINDLPNELLLNIFGYLDTPKPSSAAWALYDEPTFEITASEVANLKTVSCISKRWRAAVTPLLYRHTRLTIPKTKARNMSNVRADIQQFFDFVGRNELRKTITSFTLICYEHNFEEDYKRDPKNVLSIFWEALFEVIDPVDLMIVAPAEALSFFTACEVNDEESWNFDCPCQFLRLQRSPDSRYVTGKMVEKTVPRSSESLLTSSSQGRSNVSNAGDAGEARKEATFPNHAVLFDRPWSKLLLNEGSFIKAYSTYEFWERHPPSILSNLLGTPNKPALLSSTIRDLEYVGIFPMESHFSNITRQIPRVDRLYVQLVPRNNILDDAFKMKQVEAEDLWMERNRCYALLMRELFNTPPEGNYRYLKTFESGDAADKEAWGMAVEYVKRANVGWKVASEGVFVRDLPEAHGGEVEGSAFESSLTRWAWNGTAKLPVSSRPLYGG